MASGIAPGVAEALAAAAEEYAGTKANPQSSGGKQKELPAGDYTAELVSTIVGLSKGKGTLQQGFTFKVTEGEQEGNEASAYDSLVGSANRPASQAVAFAKSRLVSMGMEDELVESVGIEDLPDVIEELVGTTYQIRISDNGQYKNLYVNGIVSFE